MNKNILVSFELNCGRNGDIESLFVTTQEELNELATKTLHFNEVLGKHSFVEYQGDIADFNIVSEDQDKVDWLVGLLGHQVSGIELSDHISE